MHITFQKWMRLSIRQSFRYYFVGFCGFFIVIPLCLVSSFAQPQSYSQQLLTFISMIFTIMVAIHTFRFLYHSSAAMFVFSMPITRRRLFVYHYFLGWIFIQLLLLYYVWFCTGWNLHLFVNYWLVSFFLHNVIYAITVFFLSRCRRMMDAVIIGFGWLLLLAFLQFSFESFINSRSSYLIQAYDYADMMNEDLYYYFSFFSLFQLMPYLFSIIKLQTSIQPVIPLLLWWSILAIMAFVWTIWQFKKIKEEECGVYTCSYLVYPLMILIILLSLLNCIQWNEWTPFLYMMIFLIYATFYFIYKRKVNFTSHMLIGFTAVTIFEIITSFLFITTQGFGQVQEIIPKEKFQELTITLTIDLNINEENQQLIKQILDKNHIQLEENSTLNDLDIHIKNDSNLLSRVQLIQHDLMGCSNKESDTYAYRIMYWYSLDTGHDQFFDYAGSYEEMNRYLQNLFELLLENDGEYELQYYVTTLVEGDSYLYLGDMMRKEPEANV